jgi:hypothetical protein
MTRRFRDRFPDFDDSVYGQDLTDRTAEIMQAKAAVASMEWLLLLGSHLHATAHDYDTILCLAEDVRPTRGWSQGIAVDHLQVAHDVSERFQDTFDRLKNGDLSYEHVRALSQECFKLTDIEKVRWVEERALPMACRRTPGVARMTPYLFRKKVRALVDIIDQDANAKRKKQAFENRGFWHSEPEDGMCAIGASVTVLDAALIDKRVTEICKTLKATGLAEGRSMAQMRADVVADILTGRSVHAETKTEIFVHITADALDNRSATEAMLEGFGRIPAQSARDMVADSVIRRVFCTPEGIPTHIDPLRYQPTSAQRRFVQIRDVTCVVPGCTRSALRCDLDHNYAFNFDDPEYPDQTVEENLDCLCKRHHDMKTRGECELEQTLDADFIWTTPSGRQWQRVGESIFPLFGMEQEMPRYVVDYEEVAPF